MALTRGAMAMRAIMILAGEVAITEFKPILLVFAGILIFSSYKLIVEDDGEEEDMADNAIVKFVSKLLPVSEAYDGENFFTLVDGVKTATPLLLCLAVIELSDVVFAVDSIPAVFGVTQAGAAAASLLHGLPHSQPPLSLRAPNPTYPTKSAHV